MRHVYQAEKFGEDWFTYPVLYSRFISEMPSCDGVFVEVGCWKGKSVAYLAVEAINSGKQVMIYAVDTWAGSANEECHQKDPHVVAGTLYDLFLENVSELRKVISPMRMKSTEAAATFPDRSVDIVFIDAAHDYDSVCADINAWLPKVRPGGYLAGHDYPWSPDGGVKRAVDELLGEVEVTEGCWVFPVR